MARKQQIEGAAHQRNMYVGGKGNISTALIREFIAGAEWADKTLIDKACKWLEENASNYATYNFDAEDYAVRDDLVPDFKDAMEE